MGNCFVYRRASVLFFFSLKGKKSVQRFNKLPKKAEKSSYLAVHISISEKNTDRVKEATNWGKNQTGDYFKEKKKGGGVWGKNGDYLIQRKDILNLVSGRSC